LKQQLTSDGVKLCLAMKTEHYGIFQTINQSQHTTLYMYFQYRPRTHHIRRLRMHMTRAAVNRAKTMSEF